MTSPVNQKAWSERAAELRYLSIRLRGFVSELPSQSLPPRGRVQWSPAEIGELRVLTRSMAQGEDEAARAAASLDAIDTLFRRPQVSAVSAVPVDGGDSPAADSSGGAALLGHYLAQRAIAMDSLPRLERYGEAGAEPTRSARAPLRASRWQLLLTRAVAKLRARFP
jgi:hypothetical protein